MIDEAEAMHHEDRHLGFQRARAPRICASRWGRRSEIALRDTIVLASDGLSDNLHTFEIAELVRRGPIDCRRCRGWSRKRTHAHGAYEKEGDPSKPDDLTVVVFRRGSHLKPATQLRFAE